MHWDTPAGGAAPNFACEFAENFDAADVPEFRYQHDGCGDSMPVDQAYEYSAPKFIDLSTINDGNALDDECLRSDDQWFERVHPLHESRRPRKPLRPLLAVSPGDAKASPGQWNEDMDRDEEVDSSQRKRQRSCSCGSDSQTKRRLQQSGSPGCDSDGSDMNLGDDDLSEDGGCEDDKIQAMIAIHNQKFKPKCAVKLCASTRAGVEVQRRAQLADSRQLTAKHTQQGRPLLYNTRVGLTPRDSNLRRPHGQALAHVRSARERNTGSRRRDGENDDRHDSEVAAMIAAHNRKFKPRCDYAPPQHSVRDVKAWEAETGKRWYTLSPSSRVAANEAISRKKAART